MAKKQTPKQKETQIHRICFEIVMLQREIQDYEGDDLATLQNKIRTRNEILDQLLDTNF